VPNVCTGNRVGLGNQIICKVAVNSEALGPPSLVDDKVCNRLAKGVGRGIPDLMHTFKYRARTK
jgi:hypothetical protein